MSESTDVGGSDRYETVDVTKEWFEATDVCGPVGDKITDECEGRGRKCFLSSLFFSRCFFNDVNI